MSFDDIDGEILSLKEAAAYLTFLFDRASHGQSGELVAWQINDSWKTSKALCKRYVRSQIKKQALICRATYSE
ncbi:MAG: hypothetical protein ACLU6V_00505 [Lancefieldella rimae]